jgi:hypothetical protein
LKRRSFLVRLIHALHKSRRRQAILIIHQYRHLNDRTGRTPFVNPVPANVVYPRFRRPKSWTSFGKGLLVAVALAGFFALHVIGFAMLRHGQSPSPATEVISPARGD